MIEIINVVILILKSENILNTSTTIEHPYGNPIEL